jgi:curved DNA-binding protein CbpA
MDYYNILGITKNATFEIIKKAYRTLLLKFHPDKNKSPTSITKFLEIQQAYTMLSQPRTRAIFDSIDDPIICQEIEQVLNVYMGYEHNKDNVQIFRCTTYENTYYILIPLTSCIPEYKDITAPSNINQQPFTLHVFLV